MLTSQDQGKSWRELCAISDEFSGIPAFGKNEKHIFVATVGGIIETIDAGAHWKLVTTYPEDLTVDSGWGQSDRHIAYDPVHDVLDLAAFNWKTYGKKLLKLHPSHAATDAHELL